MDFNLKDHLILFVIAGSRSYGLNTSESDVDVKGVCIPPVDRFVLGLHGFEQVDGAGTIATLKDLLTSEEQAAVDATKLEGTVYGLQKFIGLCLKANPNILEALFCDEADIRFINEAGRRLREHRDLFLTKKVQHSYPGYAFSQMDRIKTHREWLLHPMEREPKRSDFGLDDTRSTLTLDEQNAFLWVLAEILKGKVAESKLTKSTKEELAQVGVFDSAQAGIPNEVWPVIQEITGAPKEFIRVMQKERAYRAEHERWKAFLAWQKTRNRTRAAIEAKCSYDAKFAVHVVRLMVQGREILETGTLRVRVPSPTREWLLHIRSGGMPFEELEAWFKNALKEMAAAAEKSTLPWGPDEEHVEELLIDLHRVALLD